MNRKGNRVFSTAKALVLLLAYAFLIYKLSDFTHWDELFAAFTEKSTARMSLLFIVLAMMPVNWALEAWKWQQLNAPALRITFRQSIKGVLAGLNSGFITPNRIGEFAGRIVFLPQGHRTTGTVLSFVNSLMQNLVIISFGLPAAIVFFSRHYIAINIQLYLITVGLAIAALALLIFTLPALSRKINLSSLSENIKSAFRTLTEFNRSKLMHILLISVLRYMLFSLQFYLMLRFFVVEVAPADALYAIPLMYLFITFTPSIFIAEPAVRGSLALLIFSSFSPNEPGIFFTVITIWLINFVVPMIAGSLILLKKREVN